MTDDPIRMLVGSVNLLLILVLFFGPWSTHVVDRARQRLFEIRDEFFDIALEAGEGDHPSVLHVRELINTHIRYAHRWSVFRLSYGIFLYKLAAKVGAYHEFEPLSAVLQRIPDESLRKAARRAIRRSSAKLMELMFARSITGIPSLLLIKLWELIESVQSRRNSLSTKLEDITSTQIRSELIEENKITA